MSVDGRALGNTPVVTHCCVTQPGTSDELVKVAQRASLTANDVLRVSNCV
jgi:hypothetical protein